MFVLLLVKTLQTDLQLCRYDFSHIYLVKTFLHEPKVSLNIQTYSEKAEAAVPSGCMPLLVITTGTHKYTQPQVTPQLVKCSS